MVARACQGPAVDARLGAYYYSNLFPYEGVSPEPGLKVNFVGPNDLDSRVQPCPGLIPDHNQLQAEVNRQSHGQVVSALTEAWNRACWQLALKFPQAPYRADGMAAHYSPGETRTTAQMLALKHGKEVPAAKPRKPRPSAQK